MKIMVLNDGTTYTDIRGCQIVEIDDIIPDERIDEVLQDLMVEGADVPYSKIIGGFDNDGNFLVGDPRSPEIKKKIILE